jgi:adenylate cyclase
MSEVLTLHDLRDCFEGAIPAVIATAAGDGTPNVTYLSRVQLVDDERVALSNQFFSKTARNLAENPRASVLLIEPTTYRQFRLTLRYERTERRGPVFVRLRDDVEALAELVGMQGVFKLRAADIYRVVDIERLLAARDLETGADDAQPRSAPDPLAVGELASRLARCPDLDTLLGATVDGLADLLGYDHSLVLLLDEDGRRLYTIASRGYDAQGVGSEVVVGEGLIGLVAARGAPMRIGSLRQMAKYSQSVRRAYEDHGHVAAEPAISLPGMPEAESRVAVPAIAYGQLIGVVMVESRQVVAFTAADEAVLTMVATILANAVESERVEPDQPDEGVTGARPLAAAVPVAPAIHVRFFAVDGSTFLDGDYLIKGVAGRILWSIVGQHEREGRLDFTHREMRLDPSLELPPFRDNFENRLLLLKRRLDERGAPIRIEKTGRGRFRLHVAAPLRLESA